MGTNGNLVSDPTSNLNDDLAEQDNIAATNPTKAIELRDMLHAWRTPVDGLLPTLTTSVEHPNKKPRDGLNLRQQMKGSGKSS